MKIVAFVGPSDVGKTRLLVRLVRVLTGRGLTVVAIKHSHHRGFDQKGSDSYRLRRAGASSVVVVGTRELALFGEAPGDPRELARLFGPVDLILCEGFKSSDLPKIEVHRRAVSHRFLCRSGPFFIAVVSDEPAPTDLPRFGAGQIEALATWLSQWGKAQELKNLDDPTERDSPSEG
jgi:molybdopterin-guanine dinucleotide biosynthesis protein MobB